MKIIDENGIHYNDDDYDYDTLRTNRQMIIIYRKKKFSGQTWIQKKNCLTSRVDIEFLFFQMFYFPIGNIQIYFSKF